MAPQSLFNDEAMDAAARHGSESHFRWLALSMDPEAVALRAGLEHCFTLAGDSAAVLRKGLLHERWGQHAGALGHLLALGLLARQGWCVACEPALGGQAPDILAMKAPDVRMLVEVRAITGAGQFPWEARRLPRGPGRATPAQREAEARDAAGAADALRETVAGVLAKKAERYRSLAGRLALPFVICLYEDKDDQIAEAVRAVAFGRSGAPDGGAFAGPAGALPTGTPVTGSPAGHARIDDAPADGAAADGLRAVSAVLVFGRLDTDDGALLLRGELLPNPFARLPLPDGDGFPLLRTLRPIGGRMAWSARAAQAFTLTQ